MLDNERNRNLAHFIGAEEPSPAFKRVMAMWHIGEVAVALWSVWRLVIGAPLSDVIVGFVTVSFIVGSAVVLLLRADVISNRLARGRPVSLFSRLLFASGIWSVLIWICLALVIGFPVAVVLGNLTANAPAGPRAVVPASRAIHIAQQKSTTRRCGASACRCAARQ